MYKQAYFAILSILGYPDASPCRPISSFFPIQATLASLLAGLFLHFFQFRLPWRLSLQAYFAIFFILGYPDVSPCRPISPFSSF